MPISSNHTLEACPEFAVYRRKAVLMVAGFCAIFIVLSSLYCYLYALYFESSDYQATFLGALGYISVDWIGWALISPILAHRAVKMDITTQAGKLVVVKLLAVATIVLGLGRVGAEYLLGGDTLATTLAYFLPRYLFVTALLVGAGVFYGFKVRTQLEVQRLQVRQAQQLEEQCEPEKLVVYRGTCRVLLQCSDIICITASGNYLEIETPDGMFLMRNTMKNIQKRLDQRAFVRIHRSYIVNLNQLESVSRARLEANLTNGRVLRVGKKYLDALPHFA